MAESGLGEIEDRVDGEDRDVVEEADDGTITVSSAEETSFRSYQSLSSSLSPRYRGRHETRSNSKDEAQASISRWTGEARTLASSSDSACRRRYSSTSGWVMGRTTSNGVPFESTPVISVQANSSAV